MKKKQKAIMAMILAGASCLLTGGWNMHVARAAAAAPAGPMKIAVVNIIKLSDRLEEKTAQTDKLQKMLASFKTEQAQKLKALKKLGAPLNPQSTIALKPGTPEYKAQEDKWAKATISYRVYIGYMQEKIRAEHMLLVEKLYHDITTAIQAYAKLHGISLVLQQEPMDFSVANDKALMTEIRSRKVLYASGAINITDHLLRTMNRQWEKAHGQ